MGGGRWLGGPGLEVRLEHKNIAYDVARHDRHSGDVTLRTRLYVRQRVGDKFRG
jgi:predicted metal-dependent hydrolase